MNRKAKSNKSKTGKRGPRKYGAQKMSSGLDPKAMEYAKLLLDPCGAPLVHPVYPGGDSGFVFRADSVFTIGTGANQTSGFLHWAPGYMNSSATDLLVAAAQLPSDAVPAVAFGSNAPGNVFLKANASAVRCVAACLKITYPGSESARSGRVHYGHSAAGLIDNSEAVKVDDLAPLLQHFGRTPPETTEVIWRPGIADTEFNDPGSSASANIRDRKSAISVAWAGLPATVGMTFHFTAVYEWLPKVSVGLASNTNGKNSSRNTLDDVLDAVQRAGFNWVRSAVHAGASGIGAGMVDSVSRMFGIMPAPQTIRTGTRFLGY